METSFVVGTEFIATSATGLVHLHVAAPQLPPRRQRHAVDTASSCALCDPLLPLAIFDNHPWVEDTQACPVCANQARTMGATSRTAGGVDPERVKHKRATATLRHVLDAELHAGGLDRGRVKVRVTNGRRQGVGIEGSLWFVDDLDPRLSDTERGSAWLSFARTGRRVLIRLGMPDPSGVWAFTARTSA
ncbi:MAG TPA: hypothetical protein VF320_03125 [Acidimicrobiales bacterium]